ncbi:MAG TPA: anti-sigma B factor RsbW [Ureibacillus sp.]|nr:anti-sigma B factor RsbW [Ureibacillus sp.]
MKAFDYVEIRVPAKPQYVSVIRLAISGLATRVGFLYDEIEDIKIAISEAVTNIVHHAYEDENGDIIIGCALYTDKIEIMVTDYGKSSFDFEETKLKVGPYKQSDSISQLREGGLGLFLMETLMDEVKVNNEGGVTVFMTKFVKREQVKEHVQTDET